MQIITLTTSLLCWKHSDSSLFCIASNIVYSSTFPRASTESHSLFIISHFLFSWLLLCTVHLLKLQSKHFYALFHAAFEAWRRLQTSYKIQLLKQSVYKQTLNYPSKLQPGLTQASLDHSIQTAPYMKICPTKQEFVEAELVLKSTVHTSVPFQAAEVSH